jgi:hypothetical protein
VLNPPILPEMPTGGVKQPVLATFPDWPNLNCEGIKAGLASLRETLMVSKFDIAVRNEYERQILIGEKYLSSCTSGTPTPPPTIVTPTPTVFGGGFPGGIRPAGGTGGAGGGGEDKKKKPFPWWWIVVGGAVLYFLTREKK